MPAAEETTAATGPTDEPRPRYSVWSVRYPRGGAEFNRLLSLVDNGAVVALTLLSLTVLVRHPRDEAWWVAFRDLIVGRNGGLLALIVSFALVGVFWLSHHQLVSQVVAIDRVFMVVNFFFLFAFTLTPVAAVAMSEHSHDSYAIGFYAVWLFALILLEALLVWVAEHRGLFATARQGRDVMVDQLLLAGARLLVSAAAIVAIYTLGRSVAVVVLVVGLGLIDVFLRRRAPVAPVESAEWSPPATDRPAGPAAEAPGPP